MSSTNQNNRKLNKGLSYKQARLPNSIGSSESTSSYASPILFMWAYRRQVSQYQACSYNIALASEPFAASYRWTLLLLHHVSTPKGLPIGGISLMVVVRPVVIAPNRAASEPLGEADVALGQFATFIYHFR